MEPHKTHTDNGWVIRIRLRIRHCALKDSLLYSAFFERRNHPFYSNNIENMCSFFQNPLKLLCAKEIVA